MKRFVTVSLILLTISGFIFLLAPREFFPSFYDIHYMGWAALAGVLGIILLPQALRVSPQAPQAAQKNRAADLFQYLLLYAVLFNAAGDLGLYELYKVGFEFDKVLHFFTPLMSVFLVSQIVQGRFAVSISKAGYIAFGLTILCMSMWELYEYVADIFLQTHLYGNYGSDVYNDTKFDLLFGLLGSVAGFCFTRLYSHHKKTL